MPVSLDQLIDAALPHVAFDGWSDASFRAAAADLDLTEVEATALCPNGARDLAVGYHRRGDAIMRDRLANADLTAMRIRERVAHAVRTRIEAVGDKEAVRRGTTFFSMPQNLGDGASLIWGTADAIWDALGDPSRDFNWYSKRATLSAVYSSVVLFWLGDESEGHQATWDFLDRRIEDVMRIETFKGALDKNPIINRLFTGPEGLLSRINAPSRTPRDDLPGRWNS